MFLASFLLQKTDITPKVAGILRQRYAECKAASKVFNNHLLKIALYGQCMSITSKMMYSVLGFFESPKDIGSVITPTSSILFPPKSYRVFVDSFNHLLSYPIFSKFDKNKTLAWLPLSTRILVTSHLSMCIMTTIASVCGKEIRLIS
jgi:hypothetical protein